jgi:hypothetical protein
MLIIKRLTQKLLLINALKPHVITLVNASMMFLQKSTSANAILE